MRRNLLDLATSRSRGQIRQDGPLHRDGLNHPHADRRVARVDVAHVGGRRLRRVREDPERLPDGREGLRGGWGFQRGRVRVRVRRCRVRLWERIGEEERERREGEEEREEIVTVCLWISSSYQGCRPEDFLFCREIDRSHLEDLALDVLQLLQLDPAAGDAGQTQQAQHLLHGCLLCHQFFDCRNLRVGIVRGQQVCRRFTSRCFSWMSGTCVQKGAETYFAGSRDFC